MPRYHFNIYDGQDDIDVAGTELPDLDAARTHALKTAGRVLQGETTILPTAGDWKMEITDDRLVPLFILSFTAASVPWVLRDAATIGTEGDGPDDDVRL